MKKIMLYCFLVIVPISCNSFDKYAKNDFIGTREINDNLYLETYCINRGGATTGNTCSCYLTDSTLFRIYLGWYEEYEQINIIPMNDSIILSYKTDKDTYIRTEKTEYNLYALRREGKFD